jgi:pimeloyl-ACP methyl ester carboxylesterase
MAKPPARSYRAAMDSVAVRGAALAFDQTGKGEIDLVLVHGFQNDRSAWDPFVERLDRGRFRITRFDLVGCGASSGAPDGSRCTIDEYARDLAALCDALEIAAPIAIGHSLGGGTVLRAALSLPGRFAGLVLAAPVSTTGLDFLPEGAFPSLCRPTPEQQRELARAAFRRPLPPEDFAALWAVIQRATPEHIEGAARSMRDFRCQAELSALAPPTLLVCADRDRHVPLRNHLATQQAIPRCGLQAYYDVGHVPFVETPDAFARDVLRFVEGLQPGGAP